MTAKRFYLDENGINDREYEFGILGEDELVDIINGIVDENEQLKETNQDLFDNLQNKTSWLSLKCAELAILKRENEQLKTENKKLNERIGILEGSLIDKGFDIND